jgi:hypothetical protein
MDMLDDYDGAEATSTQPIAPPITSMRQISVAPPMGTISRSISSQGVNARTANTAIVVHQLNKPAGDNSLQQAIISGVMTTNLPADQLWAPQAGPINPYAPKVYPSGPGQTLLGTAQVESIESVAFEEQYRSYMTHGYAADPSVSTFAVWWSCGRGVAPWLYMLSPCRALAG